MVCVMLFGLFSAIAVGLPAGAQDAPEAPTSCSALVVDGNFDVTWPAAAGAVDYLVHRSVNSSPYYWRSRVSTLSFVDSFRAGNVAYRLTSIAADGTQSAPTDCQGEQPVQAPASCTVGLANNQFDVTWPAVNGAADYIVRRSVDGSSYFWRGRVPTTSFADSFRTGTVIYTVTAVGINGTTSDPTTCDSDIAPPDPVDAPVSCSVLVSAAGFEVTWPAASGATEYLVHRSVNGSQFYWRGRISNLSFNDSFRAGGVQYQVTSVGADGTKSDPTLCAENVPPVPEGRYLAVGDMANCNLTADTDVGILLDRVGGPIIGLGDYAYVNGTTAEFNNCFAPPFGRHKDRFHPVSGNHEYYTVDAAPFYTYFGAAAGDPTKGYFSETDGDWQILYLNSNCSDTGDCDAASSQHQWLQAELAAAPTDSCRAVVLHHPRWSSWGPSADQAFLDPMFQLLDSYDVDVVLTGHAHHYERLAKLNANGAADTSGFVHFTVGTGGANLRVPAAEDVLSSSEALLTTDSGVLSLDLVDGSYSWQFISTSLAVLDSGTNTCNN